MKQNAQRLVTETGITTPAAWRRRHRELGRFQEDRLTGDE
jgi:hypothetical protein